VTGQGLVRHVLDLDLGLGEKALGGGGDRDVVAANLDLGHAVHRHGYALQGVDVGRADLDGHQLQR
jgi:hypothetical protein